MHIQKLDPTPEQIKALIHEIAMKGPAGVTVEDAVMVARFLAEECRKRGARLTVRIFVNNVLPDYRMWQAGKAENHWTVLVQAAVAREFVPHKPAVRDMSRSEQMDTDQRIALGICKEFATHQERIQAWKVRTNQTTTKFFDHYAELMVSGQL